MLPVAVNPNNIRQYYTQYHDYGYNEEPIDTTEFVAYEFINPIDIKTKIVEYLGKVLARCWIQPALLKDLENDAHACLLEMGMILPPELNIHVVKTNKNRPRLVVYETINGKPKKVCYLQLSMLASK